MEAKVNLGLAYQGAFLSTMMRRPDIWLPLWSERPNLVGLNVIVGMDYLKLGSPEKAGTVPGALR